MSNITDRHTVNLTGRLVDRIDSEIGKRRGVVVFGFYFTLVLAILSIALLFVRSFSNLEAAWIFSIGGDVFCLLVCTMLYLSCLLAKEREGAYIRIFTLLLTTTAMALFLDEMTWLVQGLEKYRVANLVINAFYYANGAVLMYMFWRYVTYALNMEGKVLRIVDSILGLFLLPHLIACFANIVYPIYFAVDAQGVYTRGEYYLVSQIYLVLCIISVIIALIASKAPRRQKLIASSFVSIPLLSYLLTANVFGISVNYSCCMVAIVLIYGVLFADRSNSIAMTERDLSLATRIQADMLPNVFPAFPERKEFDIYASMNPAKEVGGDFYDFFFLDEDHLGIVMADVSGKGVPAALFMMISMTLIKNNALSGKNPARVLEDTNNQICANNKEEMFVTAWFGILDIKTGNLVAANAGHEFPMMKAPHGNYEIYKDKHGLVIGGMEGIKYKEYEMHLDSGSVLFLYTDGVPEATNAQKELFGLERTVEVLNEDPERQPEDVLKAVTNRVSEFVGKAPQFDDLTMLCIRYNG